MADALTCSPTLMDGDFPNGRLKFQPDAKNVEGCVDVAIVRRSAVRTFPTPHCKTCDTSRPRRRESPARRTGLRTESFVGFDKHGSVPSGFVAEHMSELGPACVGHGLGHPGLLQGSGVHIADDDQTVFTNDPGGLFMEMVPPLIGDLGMDSAYPRFVAGALGLCELGLVFPVVLKGRDLVAIAKRGELLQPEVDTDPTIPNWKVIGDLALEDDIPATTGVLDEASGFVVAADLAGLPERIATFEIDRAITVNPGGARNERKPSQPAFGTEARPEAGALAMQVSGLDELAADLADGVGVKTQIGCASCGQLYQVKGGEPFSSPITLPSALGFTLRRHTEVPDCVAADGMSGQRPGAALDAVLEAQHRHENTLITLPALLNAFPLRPEGRGFRTGAPQ